MPSYFAKNWNEMDDIMRRLSLATKEKNDRPTCSSDDGSPQASGYCPKTIANREHANNKNVYYKTDDKLDSDIITTHDNIKREEKRLGHDLTMDFGEKSQQ